MDEISITRQKIYAMIKVRSFKHSWIFSCIYASVYKNIWKELLENLKNIKNNYNGKCLIGGDFNDITNSKKKEMEDPYTRLGQRNSGKSLIIAN